MAKVYLVTEADIEKLFDKLKIDPKKSSQWCHNDNDWQIFDEAHRHYNYIIHRWLDEVKK